MPPSRKGAKNWTDAERDAVFGRFPPSGRPPSNDEIVGLAGRLGRTADAVGWMWEDASAALRGRPSTASQALRDYLRAKGWLT